MQTYARRGDGYGTDATPPAAEQDRSAPSAADLIRGIAEDASTLVRQEVLLARQEVTEGLTVAAKAGSMLAVAGVVALFAVGFLLTTLAWGLVDAGLARWAGFGIVTLLLIVVAAILAAIGQKRMKQAKLAPVRAQASFDRAKTGLVEGAKVGANNVKAEAVATAEQVKVSAVALPERAREATSDGARQAFGGVRGRIGRLAGQLRRRVEERDQVEDRQVGGPGPGQQG